MPVGRCRLQNTGYLLLDAGCWMLDVWIENWLLKIVTKDILDLSACPGPTG